MIKSLPRRPRRLVNKGYWYNLLNASISPPARGTRLRHRTRIKGFLPSGIFAPCVSQVILLGAEAFWCVGSSRQAKNSISSAALRWRSYY